MLFLFLPIVGKKKGKFIIPGMNVPSTFKSIKDPWNFSNGVVKGRQKKSKRKVYVGYR